MIPPTLKWRACFARAGGRIPGTGKAASGPGAMWRFRKLVLWSAMLLGINGMLFWTLSCFQNDVTYFWTELYTSRFPLKVESIRTGFRSSTGEGNP